MHTIQNFILHSGVSRNSNGGGGILKAISLAFQFLGGVLLLTQQVDWQWCSGSGATGAYSILYDGATLWNTLDKNIVHLLLTLKECYKHGAVLHVHVWYVNHVV